jgi:hypothetical protein
MIVAVKDAKLYALWMEYYERTSPHMRPAEMRAYAYLNALANAPIPLS